MYTNGLEMGWELYTFKWCILGVYLTTDPNLFLASWDIKQHSATWHWPIALVTADALSFHPHYWRPWCHNEQHLEIVLLDVTSTRFLGKKYIFFTQRIWNTLENQKVWSVTWATCRTQQLVGKKWWLWSQAIKLESPGHACIYCIHIYLYVYNRYCKLLWHLNTIFEIYTTLISYLVKNGFCPPCFPQAAGTPNPHLCQTSKASFYMPWEVTLVTTTTFRLLKELEPTNLEWANLVQAVVIYVFAPPKMGKDLVTCF